MGGISSRTFRMFHKLLCGDDTLKNVVIVTTMWDEVVDQAKGEMREAELKKPVFQTGPRQRSTDGAAR